MSRRIAAAAGLGVLLAVAGSAQAAGDASAWRNVTTGGTLRPGVYGRIVIKGKAAPPPVIYADPVVAGDAIVAPNAKPVYLYVPPGQVRKWDQNCARWSACDLPVLFVRVDHSPSQWGRWRELRQDIALHEREHE